MNKQSIYNMVRWLNTNKDKQLHCLYGLLLSLSILSIFGTTGWVAFYVATLSLLIGVCKQWWDLTCANTGFSVMDILFTLIGSGLGILFANVLVRGGTV